MNRIAIYLRLSEEDYKKTDESISIVNQRDYIRSYIENENSLKNSEIEEYIDDGYSATNTNRPSFLRLVDDIKGGRVGTIIVKDMSRFSRDYILLGDYLSNIFPFLKIRFIAINDNYDSINENGNGIDTDTQFKVLSNKSNHRGRIRTGKHLSDISKILKINIILSLIKRQLL